MISCIKRNYSSFKFINLPRTGDNGASSGFLDIILNKNKKFKVLKILFDIYSDSKADRFASSSGKPPEIELLNNFLFFN